MISQEEPENEGNIRKLLERQTTAMKEMRREIQGLRATVEEDRKQLQKAPVNRAPQKSAGLGKFGHDQAAYTNDADTEQTQTEIQSDTEGGFTLAKPKRRLKSKEIRDKIRTYADVSRTVLKGKKVNEKAKEPWKTPETKEKHITLVEIPEGQQARDTIKKIKEAAQEEVAATGGVVRMAGTRGNKIAIVYKNREQQEKVERKLGASGEIKTSAILKQNPKIRLTGVAKGYSDEELLRTINEENPEIKTNFGEELAQKLKVVHRKDCINARKENILMEADPDIFRYLVKKEIVFIDWVPCYIQEEIGITICHNCNRFGHAAKKCSTAAQCHFCGQPHERGQCGQKHPDCPNCKSAGFEPKDRQHSARDRKCPIYRRKELQHQQTMINYGQSKGDTTSAGPSSMKDGQK
ncbi:uncharacterized protein LOC109545933 [Dendroctonus ponderosae]|uniref:uncharacterized protein LOC109545933 n=1 Tax=Dendroctonus ponderosae TaxID=77166 RepID=UPI0020350342|nr:uncharacterized protein LOC109545933 [Dendroctonus ponderosae]